MWYLPREIFDLATETLTKVKRLKKHRGWLQRRKHSTEKVISGQDFMTLGPESEEKLSQERTISQGEYTRNGREESIALKLSLSFQSDRLTISLWLVPIPKISVHIIPNFLIIGVAMWAIGKSLFTRRLTTFYLIQQKQQLFNLLIKDIIGSTADLEQLASAVCMLSC